MHSLFRCAVTLLLAAGTLHAQPLDTLEKVLAAKPDRYVTDHAGVIPAERANALNETLAQFERDTSNQVIIYTLPRVPSDTTLEELSIKAMEQWRPGLEGKDNGVIFMIFPEERVMRIEVGYGLEPVLPDSRARNITSQLVKPHFKKGDYAGGIEAGASGLMKAIRREGLKGSGKTVAERAPKQSRPSIIGMLMAAFGCGVTLLIFGGVIALIVFIVRNLKFGAPSTSRTSDASRSSNDSTYESSSKSSSRGSSSSSSSGSRGSSPSRFKGGGGRGGGGGASDRW